MTHPIRIANCSGYYGDRLVAAKEMVEGGPIDVLTGDWLAELTMLILAKSQMKDPMAGYGKTFVKQMEMVMGTCVEKGIKVVSNAGGLNPQGCAAAVKEIAKAQGLNIKVAWIGGDDLMPRLDGLKTDGHEFKNIDTGEALGNRKMMTANAYIGGWGIVEALNAGADIVITGRATDAAIVSGPAAWRHGWKKTDYDQLAGSIVAGHVIECGAQATGGNYAFFDEIPDLDYPGFPIAEIAADGSSIITKHDAHGGEVNVGTVTAQLLYEIGEPGYKNPDVISRFDTMTVKQEAPNRVSISGVRGETPPAELKVSMNYMGGWRTTLTLMLTGLNPQAKAELYFQGLFRQFPGGRDYFEECFTEVIRGNSTDPRNNEEHSSILRVVVKDTNADKVTKHFSAAANGMGIASYPGLYALGSTSQMFGVCWPTLIPAELITQQIHIDGDGTEQVIELNCAPATEPNAAIEPLLPKLPSSPVGETRFTHLGEVFAARSGDKAGNANIGMWARSPEANAWLQENLTLEKLKEIMPEAGKYQTERFPMPNIGAINFLIRGVLGEGVAASTRLDAQAKGFGEYLRAIKMDIPVSLLDS
jgi:hypothetical protein